ncbi:flavoprotein [Actinocrispum wychmicini]|uniref:Flavoprotein n=1 Tax=Actinocrispum wychmicini TaxID=1213861 RepID=A0A4R2JQ07_9PSEU|nr:flavoprotein [Actinocrispum wychmicini]TCO62283.1 flavoprotein [Actinocrispum wychmicini]
MRDDALSVIVCGSAVAVRMPEYLAALREHSPLPLRVLITHSATKFLTPWVVRWYADEVYPPDNIDLNPTEFALRSRCVVVLPATANLLASAALGLASTAAQTVLLSAPPPVVFFPAMNRHMWEHPRIRRHVSTLRGDGHVVVDPMEREVYEYWRREVTLGIAPPPADQVAKIVHAQLVARDG